MLDFFLFSSYFNLFFVPLCRNHLYNLIFIFLFSLILGKGINRIGNLLVPNDNYVKFEDWMLPILDAMLLEQKEKGIVKAFKIVSK